MSMLEIYHHRPNWVIYCLVGMVGILLLCIIALGVSLVVKKILIFFQEILMITNQANSFGWPG